jgi:dienelactone hydrolase
MALSVLILRVCNYYNNNKQQSIIMSNKCCPTDIKPAINDYKGVGSKVTLEGAFDMYVTGSGPHAIVIVYDIFGLTPNSEQLADALAQAGKCIVVIPDFLHGQAWAPSNVMPVTKEGAFPRGVEPADGVEVLGKWIMTHPNCRFDREDEWTAVKTYLTETQKVTKVGAVGMCWGGKVAFVAAAAENGLFLDAVATCHGSFLEVADVQAINVPICMLNSKDEPEKYQTDLKPIIVVEPKNVFKNFPTMHHGWMGTRGTGADTDFGQQEICDRFSEGVTDLVNFFTAAFE